MAYSAFLIGAILAIFEARRQKENIKHMIYLIILIIIGVLVGGRAFYYFGPWTWQYKMGLLTRLIKFSMFWGAGLVLYGGMAGAIAALLIYCKIKKLNYWKYLDIFALSFAIGLFIYRIGCFLGGCCQGKVTSVPWAIIRDGVAIHPTQLYESFFGLCLFLLLSFLGRKKRFDGFLVLFALISYSAARFIIEFFRYYEFYFLGLTASQWISIAILITASIILWRKYIKESKRSK